jgi:hypothetical protein
MVAYGASHWISERASVIVLLSLLIIRKVFSYSI